MYGRIIGATAAIPQAIAAGEVHRLLTSGFLHTDFLHLLVRPWGPRATHTRVPHTLTTTQTIKQSNQRPASA